ncbi:hypothetical protein ACI79C_17100 [Geodermatophilus sp. SYSU D00697]
MNEPRRPAPDRPRTPRALLIASLTVVLTLATLGSFGASFGVMTQCTDTYSCTVTSCRPCQTAGTWLDVGWIAQGVLLVVGVVSTVLSARRVRARAVRLGALLLGAGSLVLFAATTSLAARSF